MVATDVLHVLSVEEILASSPHPELRRILVVENDDEVRLIGSVTSYYLKQLAQESVRQVISGRRMRNLLNVAALS